MPQTLLGSLVLTYQPLWGRTRALSGIRLAMAPLGDAPVDALHLLQILRNFWPHRNRSLLLSTTDPGLLCTLLERAPDYSPGIEVSELLLDDPAVRDRVRDAHARGLRMVWRGPNACSPATQIQHCFRRQLRILDEEDALAALQAVRTRAHPASADLPPASPVLPGQMYEQVPSRALVDHCLDHQKAAAVMGWPTDEVMLRYRHAVLQPSARSLRLVVNAVCADVSVDVLEQLIGEDPMLSYRILTHVNSAFMGLQFGIGTLRRAILMMGYTALKDWCIAQSPYANDDVNVDPVRTQLVLQADLAEYLLDAGGEAEMRGEIHLCGIFQQLDLMAGGKLEDCLARLPLPDRITASLCSDAGPYLPYLELARALQATQTTGIVALCDKFQLSLDDVNRALLRTLGNTPVHALST